MKIIDTMGNLLGIVVHTTNILDTKAAHLLLTKTKESYEIIKASLGDAGYRKSAVEYAENELKLRMNISKKIKDEFAVLSLGWIVERTFV